MAENALSSILSTIGSKVAFSIVQGSAGTIIAPNLKVLRVRVRYNSKNMVHKMETGLYKVDSRIILPMSLEISCICPDVDTQDQLIALLKDDTSLYTVYSKGLVFPNVMVDGENIGQAPKMMSSASITLKFKKVLIPIATQGTAAQPADSSALDRGFVQLSAAAQTATGLFSSAYQSAAAGLVG
jgi:hypothetical protein